MTLNGFDMNRSIQTTIDLEAVPYDFCILKATGGTTQTVTIKNDADTVLQKSKRLGFYHYYNGEDPIEEADYFAEAIKDYTEKARFFLDFEMKLNDGTTSNPYFNETNGPTKMAEFINEFQAKTGKACGVYISGAYTSYLPSIISENRDLLWIAAYHSSTEVFNGYPSNPGESGYGASSIWQYTSSLYLDGYSGRLDGDIFYGNETDWDNLAGGTPTPITPPKWKKMPVWMKVICATPRTRYIFHRR